MADKPFDRTVINLRERPLSTDINQAQSQIDRAMRFAFERMLASRTSDASHLSTSQPAFMGDGFALVPTAPASMQVNVKKGLGWLPVADDPAAIGGIVGLDDLCSFKPVVLMADTAFAVPVAPGAPNTRIDIIEVKADRRVENPLARDVLNATTGVFDPTMVNKTLAYYLDGRTGVVTDPAPSTAGLSYKIGVAANPGVAPGVTAGYVKIAEVRVGSGVASVDTDKLVDRRQLASPGNAIAVGCRFYLDYNGGAPILTMNSVCAPPGTYIGAKKGTGKGDAEIYIIGGEIAGFVAQASVTKGVAAPTEFISIQKTMEVLMSVTGVEQAFMVACTPSFTCGISQKMIRLIVGAVHQSMAVTDKTDAQLETLTYDVSALLKY